ncbi:MULTISPECIES: uridine kinase [unclassified Streptomyces]|uniref:uridine kinase n=1 Tax=unclassified Streptomyces TaxID=2593676 RepID=UPI001F049C6A|nr:MULTISPECIES: uridine kinase [unclassified Streptomyces]MCH0563867.1 uridine kinase [Streptomyces sp. MUM 2J]MCH0571422.1 uridine kinase [Streptomyces sp. MUM 136J]
MTRASKPTRGVVRRAGDASHWCPVSSHPPAPARVVLLCGPSGSGKSLLAARSGLPVLRLDDFYKEGDDPTLPLVAGSSDIDWDDPGSWDADAAVAAIAELCRTGRTEVPVYDISLSARTGVESVGTGGAPLFIAEGIFAAEIVGRCRELGVLADALCLSRGAVTTFRRRFLRDLKEGRKSAPMLLRRGWRLMRAERSIVARQTALGAYACDRDEALARLAAAERPAASPAAA